MMSAKDSLIRRAMPGSLLEATRVDDSRNRLCAGARRQCLGADNAQSIVFDGQTALDLQAPALDVPGEQRSRDAARQARLTMHARRLGEARLQAVGKRGFEARVWRACPRKNASSSSRYLTSAKRVLLRVERERFEDPTTLTESAEVVEILEERRRPARFAPDKGLLPVAVTVFELRLAEQGPS